MGAAGWTISIIAIVIVLVIAPVIVAALGNRNDTLIVIELA